MIWFIPAGLVGMLLYRIRRVEPRAYWAIAAFYSAFGYLWIRGGQEFFGLEREFSTHIFLAAVPVMTTFGVCRTKPFGVHPWILIWFAPLVYAATMIFGMLAIFAPPPG